MTEEQMERGDREHDEIRDRQWEMERLERELETERMRLAAIGVVACADTVDSRKEARKMLPEYRSAALSDVERRVDECIALRRWKEEAMSVMPDFQEIGNELELPFGTAVSEEILPGIRRLKEQKESWQQEAMSLMNQLAEAQRMVTHLAEIVTDLRRERDEACEQRDTLAESLSFYADIAKYPSPFTGGLGSLYYDCGGVARRALAAVKGGADE